MSDKNTTLPSINRNEWPNEIEEDSIITSFRLGILENSTYESVENDNDLHYHTSYINEERQSPLPANEYTSEFMRIKEDLLVSQDVSNDELHDQSSGMEYPDFSDSFVTDVLEGHSYANRLRVEEKTLVVDLMKAGMRPKNTLKNLKERFPDNTSTVQTLYNFCKKNKVEVMAGITEMQHLLHLISQEWYIHHVRCVDSTDEVRDLCWAHPDSISLSKCFPYVFIMDATYKTNMHDYPLLEIVGVTPTHKTFSAFYCLMQRETTDDFSWALEKFKLMLDGLTPLVMLTDADAALMKALEVVFPQVTKLLCQFHINMNVVHRARKELPNVESCQKISSLWDRLVSSTTEAEVE
ncbi:hypothetical protein IFM89_011130 [Coptis chinensis]|uniref:MULE transposase domain-containing protein n=1 Tax=Coptis chinensis TaxID=261450 RepID=A0A835HJ52_9MAGN|nr:hypothetical protein IFM89_011130 [Coptis chinensis]